MMRFLLVNKRDKSAAKFESLKKTLEMSVTKYKEHFARLSKYASYLVSTETMRIRRFFRGLEDPLFSNPFLMVRRMSYAEIMDVAYGLQFGKEELRATKESHKKQKMRGSFSDGSSSRGAHGS